MINSLTLTDVVEEEGGSLHFHGSLTSASATRLSCRRVPRLASDNFMCCHTETEQKDHDLSYN